MRQSKNDGGETIEDYLFTLIMSFLFFFLLLSTIQKQI
jgi:hypothetical protein